MSDRHDVIDRIEALADEAKDEKEKFLRKNGWINNCMNPGGYWMWEKILRDGRHVVMNLDSAFQFERDMPWWSGFDVNAAVMEERRAQDKQWGGPDHDDTHDPHDWANYIGHQRHKLVELLLTECAPEAEIRSRFIKIAALARAALESMHRKASK